MNHRPVTFMFSLFVSAILMGACGLTPDTNAMPIAPPQTQPIPNSNNPSYGAPSISPRVFVERAERVFSSAPGYTTDLHFYQKEGDKTSSGIYEVTGKPDHQMKIVIKQGDSAGTKLYWSGGNSVQVRPSGLLGALVVSLDLHDQRITSIRGYTLNQIDLSNILAMLNDPQSKLLYAGESNGLYRIVIASQHLLPGCSKMSITFNASTYLPENIQMSDGHEVVFSLELENLQITPNVSFNI